MFDLEKELQDWKGRLTHVEAMRSRDVEELEQHVRDSIAALASKGGLTGEEAFLVATHRVGAPAALGREFGKVNGSVVWSRRLFWMVTGVLGYVVCRMVIGAIASVGQLFVVSAGGNGTSMGYTAVAITWTAWVLVAVSLYRGRTPRSRKPLSARFSAGVIAMCLILSVAVATLLKFGSELLVVRSTPVSDLGQAAMISTMANGMSAVLIPLVLLIVMLIIGRRMPESER